jgi:membrane fusion protein (multidrug efflux system)
MSAKLILKKYIFIFIPAIVVAVAVIAVLLGFLWSTPPMPPSPARVTLYEVRKEAAQEAFEVIGLMEAERQVELKARVSGFLRSKNFSAGDRVTENSLLFLIEEEPYRAALAQAQGDLLSAKAQSDRAQLDFDRTSDLYAKRTATKSDYDNAKAALDVALANLISASARLDQASLNLGYASIKAPFDGLINDSPFSVGSLLGPESGVLATVVSLDPIKVTFGISDKYMALFRLGKESRNLPAGEAGDFIVRLKINGQEIYEGQGSISYISPLVDRQTDTIKLKAEFDNPKGTLLPGQTVVVSLEPKEPRQALLVPKNAILTSSGQGNFVYAPVPNPSPDPNFPEALVAEVRPVTLGQEFSNGYEIVSGLSEGEKIVDLGLMSGGAMLRPGSLLEIASPQPGPGGGAGSPASPGEGAAPPDRDEASLSPEAKEDH